MIPSKIKLNWTQIHYWFHYYWQRITPTYRLTAFLGFLGCGIGGGLLWGLNKMSSSPPSSKNTSPTMGWVADRDLPEATPAQPLFFTFQSIEHPPCEKPVSFSHSDHLQAFQLKAPLNKGDVLCWDHLLKRKIPLAIRRGYRALGFRIKNPEILPFLTPDVPVDALVINSQQRTTPLNNVRVLDLFLEAEQPLVLLEISSKQLSALEPLIQDHLPTTLILKNKEEGGTAPIAKMTTPKIFTDTP